jgi:hypothetical protein
VATVAAIEEPTPTPVPSPAVVADPLPIVLEGPASANGEPTIRRITPAGGRYGMAWWVYEPFDPAIDQCGVTIGLNDASGAYAGGVEQVSRIVTGPADGVEWYSALDPGVYQLFVYVGCPWRVDLRKT